MDCPFMKRTYTEAGRNTGSGYPMEWISVESFKPCEGKNCAAFDNGKCLLIGSEKSREYDK